MVNYIEEYSKLHKDVSNYGSSGIMYLEELCLIINYLKPKSILDYGCGKGSLIKELSKLYPEIKFYGYDPAIEDKNILAVTNVDLVINTDVLEHIPEAELDSVINNIASLSKNVFFCLHHALANIKLPNGENAHCTVKPPIWYYELFKKYFNTPYPLKGRTPELSTLITFAPSIEFLRQYDKIVSGVSNLSESIDIKRKHALFSLKMESQNNVKYRVLRIAGIKFKFKMKNS